MDTAYSILSTEYRTVDNLPHTVDRRLPHEIHKKEQRLDIGKRIYDGKLSRYEAAEEYGISNQTVRDYMRQYRDANNLPLKYVRQHTYGLARAKSSPAPEGIEDYESMTKEELIDALIMARINEARLKKTIWWKELVWRRRLFGSSRRIPSDHVPMYNIARSMSRAGTPTDNAAMEPINSWVKTELFTDFHITSNDDVPKQVDNNIRFFNEERPAYTLGYRTPKQYREQFGSKHSRMFLDLDPEA